MTLDQKPPSSPPFYRIGYRWAVRVGINEYDDVLSYGHLKVCGHDVTKIRKKLIAGGFDSDHIQLLTDKEPQLPLREKIIAALQSVFDATDPDDMLLFYFSGHGDEENGKSYLVPCNDRDNVSPYTAVSISYVKKIMEQAKAWAKVLVLDVCHSGVNIRTKGARPMSVEFISHVFEQAAGLAIIASCTQRQFSYEWSEKQCSVFTYYLLEALHGQADRNEKGFVTMQDVNWPMTHA